jgi:filamentous hemagglutinin family protein
MSKRSAARIRAELKSSASFRWSRLLVSGVGAGLVLAFPALSVPAWANPKDGTVSTGSATISAPSNNVTKVDQTSEGVVINWSSFNVGTGQTTQFVQPNAQAIAVNRIGGANASQILGTLDANGRVVLINGNGILFGKNSQVNVGSLIATSTDGSDSDVLSGKFTKAGRQNAAIVNNGVITVGTNGTVALVAPNVTNNGTVQAKLGTVALGAANQFTVDFAGDGLVSFAAQGSVNGKATATNMGLLSGANVSMTARAAEGLAEGVVNASGMIQAQGVQNIGGTIVLDAGDGGRLNLHGANLNASGANGGGTVTIGGWNQAAVSVDTSSSINASAIQSGNGGKISVISNDTSFAGSASARGGVLGGSGGMIETSGHTLSFAGSHIDAAASRGAAGTWLLDPDDLDIDATAASSIDGSLSGGTSVVLQTTSNGTSGPGTAVAGEGNINIDSALSWNSIATLEIEAYHSININAPITIAGAGSLVLTTNYAGGSGGDYFFNGGNVAFIDVVGGNTRGSLTINNQPFTLANSISQLANDIATGSGSFALAAPYNAGGQPIYTSSPISATLSTTFEGLGNTISNLSIDQSSAGNVGLFASIGYGGTVRDIGLVNVNVVGSASNSDVGGLAGSDGGTIDASFVTGAVSGGASSSVGGLAGYVTSSGGIYESSATGTVTDLSSGGYVGGLAGDSLGIISGASANEAVSGGASSYVGGLVGYNENTVTYSTTAGSVSGPDTLGGFIGDNSGTVSASYAESSVSGGEFSGGFVGINTGTITGSYSTGPVGGTNYLGGFVGENSAGSIGGDYSLSSVSGANFIGGFVGENNAAISNSYATGSVTGSTTVGGFAGLNQNNATIADTYSLGRVTGSGNVGGFVGADESTGGITSSYWDTTTSGVTNTADGSGSSLNDSGITGLNAAGMMNSANYAGWTFGGLNSGQTWVIIDADGSLNNASGAAGGTAPMLLSEYSTAITNAHQLQLMELDPTANYTLANNINASGTAGGDVWGTAGFVAVGGNAAAAYSGTFDGAGYSINGLTIDDATNTNVGLFGYVSGAIENVGLQNAAVTGSGADVGALAGELYYGTVSNSSATGSVTGTDAIFGYVGGLVGYAVYGTIGNATTSDTVTSDGFNSVGGLLGEGFNSAINSSFTTGAVAGEAGEIGGLVGEAYGGTINASFATGSTTSSADNGSLFIGGLIGWNQSNTITDSYATGTVNGQLGTGGDVGGLAGYNWSGTITGSYATGSVTGGPSADVGGLVGYNLEASITNSYALGNVIGGTNSDAGGLVGYSENYQSNESSITYSYASGSVTGASNSAVGGFTGENDGYIEDAYSTGSATGGADSAVGGFAGDLDSNSQVYDSYSRGAVTAGHGSSVGGFVGYDGSEGGVGLGDDYWDTTTSGIADTAQGAGNVGNDSGISGLTATQMMNSDNFDWDFGGLNSGATWVIVDTDGTLNNAGGAAGGTTPILLNEYSTSIVNLHQLQLMELDPTATYTLASSINASGTSGGDVWGTQGFIPIGNSTTPFSGTFSGYGNAIYNLTIDQPSATYVGLFGYSSGTISNVELYGGSVTGSSDVGGIAGFSSGPIINVTSDISVTGSSDVGGVAGLSSGAIISASNAGSVTGSSDVGGIAGSSSDSISTANNSGSVTGNSDVGGIAGLSSSSISDAYDTGAVVGTGSGQEIGGLLGVNQGGSVTGSYASGSVTASAASDVGGLVGWNDGTISESYAAGSVTGYDSVGGLIGVNEASAVDTYETGAVSGNSIVGGLIGANGAFGSIDESYEIGAANGNSYVGGIAGYGNAGGTLGATTAVYYNSDANGSGIGGGTPISQGGGLSFANMQNSANFSGWTFGTTGGASGWVIVDADGSLNNSTSAPGGTTPLLLDEYATNIANAHQLQLMELDPTVSYSLANSIDASGTAGGDVWGGGGFIAIGGNSAANFSGAFFGNGQSINALTINDSTNSEVGLFGEIAASGSVDSVVLTNVSVIGGANGADIGGLVGKNYGLVFQSSVSGSVADADNSVYQLGGLAGSNGGTISQSFATDIVTDSGTGASSVGGLAGVNLVSGSIAQSYAAGTVILGSDSTIGGGLVGSNLGTIDQTYSLGSVAGGGVVGGLIGQQSGTVTNSYWDTDTSDIYQATGSGSASGITGDTTTELQSALPAGFDPTVWNIVAGSSFPYLSWQFYGTPEVVSGYVYSDAGYTPLSGTSVNIISGGSELGTTASYANGYYYDLLAQGAIASTGVAASATGDGIAYTDATGQVGNLDIYGGELTASTSSTSLAALAANLGATFGNLFGPAQTTINGLLGNIGDDLAVNASGSFNLDQGVNVSQALSITAGGNLTVSASIGTSDTLSLTTTTGNIAVQSLLSGSYVDFNSSGTVGESGAGAIDAGVLEGFSSGGTNLNGANQVTTLNGYSNINSGGFSLNDTQALTVTDEVVSGPGNLSLTTTSGGISIESLLSAGSQAILHSAGTITESGNGQIDANLLSGSSTGGATLNGGNDVNALGTFTNAGSGGFALTNDQSLTVNGAVNAGSGDLSLTTDGGNLVIAKLLTTTGTATLTASEAEDVANGTIRESGTGAIDATTLTGSADSTTTLNGANQIANLGAFTNTGGNFALTDDESLTLNGTLNAGNYGVTLADTGMIGESTGTIVSSTLAGSSSNGTTLNGANQIATLDAFTNAGSGGFALTDSETLSVNGTVDAGSGSLSLTTDGGNILISSLLTTTGTANLSASATEGVNGTIKESGSGAIDAATLTGSADSNTTLNGANQIGDLDAFTNIGGAFALTDNESLTISGTLNTSSHGVALVDTGTIGESTGNIDSGTLTGTSNGGATLNGANVIATLNTFTNTGSGGFALTDGEALTVNGAVNSGSGDLALTTTYGNIAIKNQLTAGGNAVLSSAGTLVESESGAISAASLTGGAGGATTLNGVNEIASLGAFSSTGGNFALKNHEGLTVSGTLNAAGYGVTLVDTGSIAESTGAIDAGTLTGSSSGGATLNGANEIAALGAFTNTGAGGFALTDDQSLTVDGTVTGGSGGLSLTTNGGNLLIASLLTTTGTADLSASATEGVNGTIKENGSGAIDAATLTGGAAGATTLNGANQIAKLGAFTNTGGAFALTDDENLSITGTLNASSYGVTLVDTGTIAESTGTIDAGSLTGSSDGVTRFNGSNLIGTLGAFTNAGAGGFSLIDGEALTINGAVNAGSGTLALTTTSGNLSIANVLTTTGATTLTSAGTLKESGSGAIDALSLGGSSAGGTTLNGANEIATLNTFTNTGAGGFALSDGETLTVNGAVNSGAGNLSLATTSGNIAIKSQLTAGNQAALTSEGTLIESGSGAISAATLTGSSDGTTSLNGANQIATLGAFTNSGAGGFALTDGEAVSVNGAVNSGSGNLALTTTSGGIVVKNQMTSGNKVTLGSAGTIAEIGSGAISATSLTGSSVGSAALNGSNAIATLDAFTDTGTGGFALTDGETLTVGGTVNAGNGNLALTTTTGSLNIGSALESGGTATLKSAGSLSETGAGAVDAATLTGTSAGGATLAGSNVVATLGAFTNAGAGGFALTDGEALTVGGAVSAGTGNLTLMTTSGGITLDRHLTAGGQATLSSSGALTESGQGAISAASLTGSSTGGASLNGANQISTLDAFTNSGAGGFALTDGEALNVSASLNAGSGNVALTTTSGGISIANSVNAGGQATLISAGTLAESGAGVVDAASLTGSSVGGTNLNGANLISTLGGFANTGSGDFVLDNGEALTVTGTVNAGSGNLTLATTSGGIAVEGQLTAGAQATLNSAGTLAESGSGAISAGSLTGSAVGGATLNGANQIATLDAFTNTGSGNFALTDGQTLIVGGAIGVGGGNLALTITSGGLAIDAALNASTVVLSSTGSVTQTQAITASDLDLLGTGGNYTLTDASNSVGTVAANTGSINLTDNPTLIVNTAGSTSGITTTGNATLTSVSGGIEIENFVSSGARLTVNTAGPLSEVGSGAIDAATLAGSTVGGATLNGTNLIAALGNFSNTQTGNVSIKDNEALAITGNVNVVTGSITTPYGSEPVGALTLKSTGTLSESGAGRIVAGTFMGSSVGGATLNGANLITTIDSFANSGSGNIGLTNAQTLTVSGPVNAGSGNLTLATTSGNLAITGTVEGNTVTLGSTLGSVTGSGPITASLLNVTANTGIDLTGANDIAAIGTNETNSGPDFINR